MTFYILFIANLKIVLRNKRGFFWTVVMPAGVYVIVSILPINILIGNFNYPVYLLPGIIAMVIMQGGIYTLAYWTVDLKGRGVIKRLQVTPISKGDLILSLVLSRSVVMIVQVALLTIIGMVFFGVQIQGSVFYVGLLTIMGGFIFLPLGLLISTFANSYEAAAPITGAIGLPFTFLGNVFYPVESLPPILATIGRHLPITYLADAFRNVYLYPSHTYSLMQDFTALIVWIVIILSLVIWRFRFEEE